MNTKKLPVTAAAVFAVLLAAASADAPPKPWYEKVGIIPTREVAEAVALPILEGLYGKSPDRPLKLEARLRQQIWIVEQVLPDDTLGEPMEIWIRRDNGEVVWMNDLRSRFRDRFPDVKPNGD